MALGGYKFKGYRYTVPSDFDSSDDSQVKTQCLEMFKCRLKAFIDSCSLSGARWEFSYTDGDFSFGNYGRVIYTLDADGYNHAAFFKYYGKDQYMMLMNYQSGSLTNSSFIYLRESQSYTYYDVCKNKSSCGLVPFTPSNWNSLPGSRLRYRGTFGPNSVAYSSEPNISTTLYGFATKSCDVIEISKAMATSVTDITFKVMSPDGFSSLCSPNDIAPVFDYASKGKTVYTYSSPRDYDFHVNYYPLQTLRDDASNIGVISYSGDGNSGKFLSIFSQHESYYSAQTNRIPYAAPLLTGFTYGINNSDFVISQDGMRSKGYIKPELMAINTPWPYTDMLGLNIYKPYAGGNYLLAEIFFIGSSNTSPVDTNSKSNGAIYVGWDPSNPDITQSGAWDDYIPQA